MAKAQKFIDDIITEIKEKKQQREQLLDQLSLADVEIDQLDELIVNIDKDIPPFKVNEDLDTPAKYSSNEAKLHIDADIKKMSKFLGKASQECIRIMMDGVKAGKYDALDIQRGIKFGAFNRTHEGERPFMSMLWRKVRKGFRRYMPKGKLRK